MHTQTARTARWLMGVTLFVVSTVFMADAQQSASLKDWAGEFDLTLDSPQGQLQFPLSIKETEGKLRATLTSPQGSTETSAITLKGSDLSLQFDINGPQGNLALLLTVAGPSDDGVYKVTVDFGMGQTAGTAKRRCPPDCKK